MKTIARVLAVVVSAAAATTAVAGDRLSEAAYLKAARCQGLAHATTLGPVDTAGIDAFMKSQGEGRDARVRNQAKMIVADVRDTAQRAGNKARYAQERDSRCAAWLGPKTVANSGAVAAR